MNSVEDQLSGLRQAVINTSNALDLFIRFIVDQYDIEVEFNADITTSLLLLYENKRILDELQKKVYDLV